MKKFHPFPHITAITSATLLCSPTLSHAAMFYTIGTDNTGAFIEGGYSGDGIVQPNAGGNVAGNTMVVENFTSGALQEFDLGRTAVQFDGFALLAGSTASNAPTPLGANMTIQLNGAGATADFYMNREAPYVGKPNIRDMQNVESFDIEFTWAEPIAAPLGGPPIAFGPFLIGLARTGDELDIDMEILGLSHTLDGVTANWGLPAGAAGIDMGTNEAGNVWGTGASSSFTLTNATTDWQGIHGFDPNGGAYTGVWPSGTQGDAVIQDVETVYATGFKLHVEPTAGGTFTNGSVFIFSTNGNQWADSIDAITALHAVPEPSATLLVIFGGLLTIRRRRS